MAYREDETIQIPQMHEDGVFAIGDLFDCVTSKSVGYNLFGQDLRVEHMVARPQRDFDYTLDFTNDTKDRNSKFRIDASLSMDFLAGKFSANGQAIFDVRDTEKLNTDTVTCKMNLDSFVIKALPAAKEVIDSTVEQLLETNTIKATHVCTQIYLGAEAVATVTINDINKFTLMEIGGRIGGSATFPVGPIEVTIKAEIGITYKQEDTTDTIIRNITVKSKPPTISQPTSVKEMFQCIQAMPKQIENEQHYKMFTNAKVVGVPLRFVMVPINEYLSELDVRRTYLKLNVNLERAYQEMMFALIDFQILGHFENLVLRADKSILPILEDLENPLSKEIGDEAKTLRVLAIKLYEQASILFQKYKEGDATAEDLQNQIDKYNEEFKIHEVYMHIQAYAETGKKLLRGIHSNDLDKEDENVKFFTNSRDLEAWQLQERTIKVLLLTNAKGDSPGGAFLTLYKLSPFLKNYGIEVGVAYPNISKNFSLIIKSKHLECEYTQSDIEFALEILAVAVGEGKHIHTTFYTVMASLSGIKLPLKENLEDINPLIAAVKETKNIQICPTYLILRDAITEFSPSSIASKWKFVVEVNAPESAAETLKFFRRFYHSMSATLKSQSEWILGSFGLHGFHDAPLLFLFRDGELRTVCLDNLDLLILQEELDKSIRTPDLDLLSPEKLTWRSLYPDRLNFALQVLELLGQNAETLTNDTGSLESLGFKADNTEYLENATKVTHAALTRSPVDFLSAFAVVCLSAFKDDESGFSDLMPIFKKNGWIEVTNNFPFTMNGMNWKVLEEDTKEFFKKRNPFLTIVEHTVKRIQELYKLVGTETDSSKNALAQENQNSEVGTTEKNAEKQIHEAIKGILLHKYCPEKLKAELEIYYFSDPIEMKANGAVYVLEAYLEEIFSQKENSYLSAFINLAEEMSAENSSTTETKIMDIVRMFVLEAANNPAMQNYTGASKSLIDYAKRQNLYETLSLLSKFKWSPKLYLLQHKILNLTDMYDIDALTQLVIDMDTSGFKPDDYYDVWQNPKFVHFYTKGLYIDRVIDSLKVYQCTRDEGSNEVKISDFLPLEFQDRIGQLIIQEKKHEFVWETDWADENIVLRVLQSIAAFGFLPSDFNAVLQQNVTQKEKIKEIFKASGILYFWNEMESLFVQPWDILAVEMAAEKLDRWLSKQNLEDLIPVDIEIKHESQDPEEGIPIRNLEFIDSWNYFTNDSIFKVSDEKFREMTKLTNKFEKGYAQDLKTSMNRVVPFLQENLKMYNMQVLDHKETMHYIPYPKLENSQIPGKIEFESDDDEEIPDVPFISRADFLNFLISISDSGVSQQLLLRFRGTRFSLPLILPEIIKQKNSASQSRFLLPFFKNFPIEWKTTIESTPIRNHLFSDPCRLIVAIRIGNNIPGKSFLLNSVLYHPVDDPHDARVFSSIGNPGFGKPVSLDGLVEFTWLTEKTCGHNLWQVAHDKHYKSGKNEALLLANVHGEIFNHLDILREINKIASCFFVFAMPDTQPILKEKVEALSQIVHKRDFYYMLVKPPVDGGFDLEDAKQELLSIFGTVFTHKTKQWKMDELEIKSPIIMPSDVHLPESKKLIKRIQTDTCPTIREVMQLQKLPQYNVKEFNTIWKINSSLHAIISMFASILTLPPRMRNAALAHIQKEIRILSFYSTENNRKLIFQLTNELRQALVSVKVDSILNIQNRLAEERLTLANRSLDLEHFFREIGRVYEATDHNVQLNYDILNAYAEYIDAGNEIEIFSHERDSGDIMWGRWLKDALTRSKLFRKYRVFVLSVLGLTSSGKSTLLNTLFGSNFAVHDGGCTRGLHMRLVFPNAQLVEELRYDVILVIDSEGLGDSCRSFNDEEHKSIPNQRYDGETEMKLRQLAAFVLGISDLTLLCVRGKSMHEMKSILEIAFTKLLMVGSDANSENMSTPDLLIVQHEDETGPIDYDQTVVNELKQSLIAACDLTENHELRCGVRIRGGIKLRNIMKRVKVDNVLRVFKPFLSQDSNNVEIPSLLYHQSARDLYTEILEICRTSTGQGSRKNFLHWYTETERFWTQTMCSTEFPMNFMDYESIEEHFLDQLALEEVKDSVELAFKSHQHEINEKMQRLFWFEDGESTPFRNMNEKLRGDTLLWLKNRLNQTTATCKLSQASRNVDGVIIYEEVPCRPCQKALKLKESIYRRKTITVTHLDKINQYIDLIRENIWNQWTQALMAREMAHGKSKEFDSILKEISLGDCWNLENICNKTDLKRIIALRTTVIGPRRHIQIEASSVYANLPHILGQLGALEELPSLGEVRAFDLGYYNVLKNVDEMDSGPTKTQYLSGTQQDWIQEKIRDVLGLMLKVHQAELYEIGFIREIQRRVQVDILEAFEAVQKEKLLPDFKWQSHLYAIKLFTEQMEALQQIWDEKNQPLRILQDILEKTSA